jgi:hypothetical protein
MPETLLDDAKRQTCEGHRTPRAFARCYNAHTVRRWLIAGAAIAVLAMLAAVVIVQRNSPPDPLVADFHVVERRCLATFTDALHRQGRNEIDELALAQVIDREVLPPWHAFRLRVEAAPESPLVLAMRRYFEDRETAWRAYVVVLQAPAEAAAALATYRQKNTEADNDARTLAHLLPRP